MSIALAIGVLPVSLENALSKALSEGGLSAMHGATAEDPSVAECLQRAHATRPGMQWFVLLDQDGRADFDIACQLPSALGNGPLGGIIEELKKHGNCDEVCIFMYDMGTSDYHCYDDLDLDSIRELLTDWYEKGGPLGSVMHCFKPRAAP